MVWANFVLACTFIVIQSTLSAYSATVSIANGSQPTNYFEPGKFTEEAVYESSADTENATESENAGCPGFSLDPGEYTMFDNGTAFVELYNKSYEPSSYTLNGDILFICVPIKEIDAFDPENGSTAKFGLAFTHITVICLVISMLCLVLHLVVFFMVPDMRNLPGYNLASLCFSLLFGYVFFMVAHAKSVEDSGVPCISAAIGLQFFMLSAFLWMSTMAFDVYRSLLKATGKLRLASRKFSCRKYSLYCLYSWGTPLVFSIITLVLDNVEGIRDDFRPMIGKDICWFRQKTPLILLFAAPVILVILSNMVLFGLSAYIIFANRMRVEGDEAYKSMLKRNFLMHSRLATIMGLAWFMAILANFVNMDWLWYIYLFLNTLQGLFIFLAFTCTAKVKKYLETKFNCHGQRKKSNQSSSPTFQSYWNNGLSYDTEMDFASEMNIVKADKP